MLVGGGGVGGLCGQKSVRFRSGTPDLRSTHLAAGVHSFPSFIVSALLPPPPSPFHSLRAKREREREKPGKTRYWTRIQWPIKNDGCRTTRKGNLIDRQEQDGQSRSVDGIQASKKQKEKKNWNWISLASKIALKSTMNQIVNDINREDLAKKNSFVDRRELRASLLKHQQNLEPHLFSRLAGSLIRLD